MNSAGLSIFAFSTLLALSAFSSPLKAAKNDYPEGLYAEGDAARAIYLSLSADEVLEKSKQESPEPKTYFKIGRNIVCFKKLTAASPPAHERSSFSCSAGFNKNGEAEFLAR